jgi:hypothetical protein
MEVLSAMKFERNALISIQYVRIRRLAHVGYE